jgi:hypothetical protein
MKPVVSSPIVSSIVLAVAFLAGMASATADDRTQKYRSGGCEVERKYGDTGKYESKVECKPGRGVTRLSSGGEGKEEFKRNGCEVKREWKQNGEYKEEVKCD